MKSIKFLEETGEGCLRTLIGFGPEKERRDDLTELSHLYIARDLHGAPR